MEKYFLMVIVEIVLGAFSLSIHQLNFLFLELPDFDGVINNKRFRGYYVKVYSSSKFRDLIRILTNKGISFNFILQKGIYNYFDIIFFVRNCNRILTKDLNFIN